MEEHPQRRNSAKTGEHCVRKLETGREISKITMINSDEQRYLEYRGKKYAARTAKSVGDTVLHAVTREGLVSQPVVLTERISLPQGSLKRMTNLKGVALALLDVILAPRLRVVSIALSSKGLV